MILLNTFIDVDFFDKHVYISRGFSKLKGYVVNLKVLSIIHHTISQWNF